MSTTILIKIGIVFCYYHISAMATTDILRQLNGSKTSVFDVNCYCSNCNHKIPLSQQIPIFSYLFSKGKCKFCGNKIGIENFLLETIFFLAFSVVSVISNFNMSGIIVCFGLYEIVKSLLIIFKGNKKGAVKSFLLSLLMNILTFSLVLFLSYLNCYINSLEVI